MIESGKHSNRSKHIDVKYHVIKNLKDTDIIELQYCASKAMVVDIMTKPAPKPEFIQNRERLKSQDVPPLWD